MHDLLVHRRANGAGKPAVALERGNAPFRANEFFGQLVQLERGHARTHVRPHFAQHLGRQAASFLHGLYLGRRLSDDHAPHLSRTQVRFSEQYSKALGSAPLRQSARKKARRRGGPFYSTATPLGAKRSSALRRETGDDQRKRSSGIRTP